MIIELSPLANHLHVALESSTYTMSNRMSIDELLNIMQALFEHSADFIILTNCNEIIKRHSLVTTFKPTTYVYCDGETIPDEYVNDLEVELMEFSVYALFYEVIHTCVIPRSEALRQCDESYDSSQQMLSLALQFCESFEHSLTGI